METTTTTTNMSPEGLNFKETELTLGLPGDSRSVTKRGFAKTIDLKADNDDGDCDGSETEEVNSAGKRKTPIAKAQVIGWPPVRQSRKQMVLKKRCRSNTYIKVAVDGAPYLRKVDLEMYASYQQLLSALEKMFTCFTISNESKLMDPVNGTEYVPTYEDKDGDWMLVGDVPWKMFVDSCKRLRLMKSSEALGLAPRTPPKSTSTS